MLKKLKSVSKDRVFPLFPLVLKSLAFSGVLFLSAYYGGFFLTALFMVFAVYVYFRSFVELETYLRSYVLLMVYSWLITRFVTDGFYVFLLSLAFGFLFFLLIGVKNLVFTRRQAVFNFFIGVMYFLVAVTYYVSDKGFAWGYFGNVFLAFTAIYVLLKDILDFASLNFPKKKKTLVAAGSAFLAIQIMGVISLLPLGFLSLSALTILLLFVLEDFIFYHVKGGLTRQAVINNLIVLGASIIFIFSASKWSL